MHFSGVIVSSSCQVEAADPQLTVKMGEVSSNRFHFVGEDVNPVPFDIQLTGCSPGVRKRVRIAFYGVADNENPDLLSSGSGAERATGIGIALFDRNNQLIPLNGQPKDARPRNQDPTLRYVAKYRTTSEQVSGGKINAQVWFALTYQ